MGESFITYVARLELMAFFTAYPLLYAVIHVAGDVNRINNKFFQRSRSLLPYAYALCATLYIGLQVKNIWPELSFESFSYHFSSWLTFWGLLAILFWIPAISRRPIISLLHSLVVFFFLLKDLYLHAAAKSGKEVIQNDMKIFTDSLILNSASLLIVIGVSLVFSKKIRKKNSVHIL